MKKWIYSGATTAGCALLFAWCLPHLKEVSSSGLLSLTAPSLSLTGNGSITDRTVLDTGQVFCYNNTGAIGSCNTGGFPGQDAKYIDVPRARSLAGPTPDSAFPSDTTTTDNVTGLIWKSCSEGLSGSTCATGSAATNTQSAAGSACSALNSANASQGYAGRTDWRLPTIRELATIVKYSTSSPAADSNFPNVPTTAGHWTSTIQAGGPDYWALSFDQGIPIIAGGSMLLFIHCVAGSALPSQAFVDQGDGTVLDQSSGLIWQQADAGPGDWKSGLQGCSALTLAGRSWRMPNVNELLSLVDFSASAPTINGTLFPGTDLTGYWSSTTVPASTASSWVVDFSTGAITQNNKDTTSLYYRCVSGP